METILSYYFIFGLGFYVGMSLKDPKVFIGTDLAGVLKGLLLGLVFWPLGIVVQGILAIEGTNQSKK